jgi:hypothetical protein
MTFDDASQRTLRNRFVEAAADAQTAGHVVLRATAAELIEEPQPLLCA